MAEGTQKVSKNFLDFVKSKKNKNVDDEEIEEPNFRPKFFKNAKKTKVDVKNGIILEPCGIE